MPRRDRDTARVPRIIGVTTAMLLMLSVNAMAQQASNPQDEERNTMNQQSAHVFPAVGRTYRVDFGGGNAFDIEFGHDSDMTFTKLQPPNQGMVETIHYTHRQLRDGLYMVYWQEKDKTTVVHVEDFEKGIVYSNITSPDGNFFNGQSKLERVK